MSEYTDPPYEDEIPGKRWQLPPADDQPKLSQRVRDLTRIDAKCPLCHCEDSHTDCGAMVCGSCGKRCTFARYRQALAYDLVDMTGEIVAALEELERYRVILADLKFKELREENEWLGVENIRIRGRRLEVMNLTRDITIERLRDENERLKARIEELTDPGLRVVHGELRVGEPLGGSGVSDD